MMIFWLLLFVGLFMLAGRYIGNRRGNYCTAHGETALDILNKRLASGEITEEEYDRLREKQKR